MSKQQAFMRALTELCGAHRYEISGIATVRDMSTQQHAVVIENLIVGHNIAYGVWDNKRHTEIIEISP